jgi:hypothetical protein
MSLERFRYELRILGKWVLLMPLLVMSGFALMAVILLIMHVDQLRIAQMLTASLEMILPLVAGLLVATISGHDAAIELHLTLSSKYRFTVLLRISLIVVWIACVALFSSVFIYHLKFWRVPQQVSTWQVLPQFLVGELTWIAPLFWFVAVGCCLALLIRSRSASSAVLGGIWIVEAIFYGYFALIAWLRPVFLFPTTLAPGIDFWLLNRLELLSIALAFLGLGWLLLYNTEALLRGLAGEE